MGIVPVENRVEDSGQEGAGACEWEGKGELGMGGRRREGVDELVMGWVT